MNSGFLDVLHAHGPAVDQEKKMALYGQFIGSWDTDIVTHEPNGVEHRGNGEIHFGWVLEGRAIQDVWMIPRRAERHRTYRHCLSPATGTAPRCGSTIPASMPGTSCGPIRPIKSTRNRLGGRAASTSFRKGSFRLARSCVGALRRSPPIRFAGSVSIQPMTAFPGGSGRGVRASRRLTGGEVIVMTEPTGGCLGGAVRFRREGLSVQSRHRYRTEYRLMQTHCRHKNIRSCSKRNSEP